MKITLTFKTPDVLDSAVMDCMPDGQPAKLKTLDRMFLERFVSYGEYIVIDFDTDRGTATVREVNS